MKNQYAAFEANGSSLSISFTKSKRDYRVRFNTRDHAGKKSEGKPEYFDLNDEGAKKAEEHFKKLFDDAKASGWNEKAVTVRGKERMVDIPKPPTAPPPAENAKNDGGKKKK